MTRLLYIVIFAAGLAVAFWIGRGYVAANPLALAVTVLIIVAYLAGALELFHYHKATSSLIRALSRLSGAPASLGDWLAELNPALRNAVRLRIEGQRVGLPGPSITPYLLGLLVLLGMLGTFLGMVSTLRGTGLALESSTDLQAIRASLAAPVQGLGFAFGTSVAGVATSAMLGLLSALLRRERMLAARRLDTQIATTLRIHSQTHQREEELRLLQRQAEIMPAVVDRLQDLMTAMAQQNKTLNEKLVASQDAFHARIETAYTQLASSVAQSLREGIADGTRAAGTAIQPLVENTMASLARENATMHDAVTRAMQQQLDGLSSHLETTTASVAQTWDSKLAAHQQTSESLAGRLYDAHNRFIEGFDQRIVRLLGEVDTRLGNTSQAMSEAWQEALARHETSGEKLADDHRRALMDSVSAFEQQASSLLSKMDGSHTDLRAGLMAQDEQRLAAWAAALDTATASMRTQWEAAAERAASQQEKTCDALAKTAQDVSTETQAQAGRIMAEIAALAQTAAQAPEAAAQVIAEVREKLSDSMARDNALLEERGQMLETVNTLLDAVNHASSEQRSAVDALVATSAQMLARMSEQFSASIETQAGKLTSAAAQITGGAAEVASLGEAFGVAVGLFSQSSETLVGHLQRLEAALEKSLTRSDEQLAYYVAQAREVVDLSLLSQKQILDDLQNLSSQAASVGTEAA